MKIIRLCCGILQWQGNSWSGRRNGELGCSTSALSRSAGGVWRSSGRKRSSAELQWRRRGGSSWRKRGSADRFSAKLVIMFQSDVFSPQYIQNTWLLMLNPFWSEILEGVTFKWKQCFVLHSGATWSLDETLFGEKPTAGAENKTLEQGLPSRSRSGLHVNLEITEACCECRKHGNKF